jgi:hypothetical protein
MNFKRGFRRIIFILSLLVALTAATFCFVIVLSNWEDHCYAYDDSKNNLENVTMFWRVWETDGWIVGKYGIVKHLLDSRTQYLDLAGFDVGDKKVYIKWYDVFPGINETMLSMPLATLDKEAQTAKRQAIEKAKREIARHEYWGTKNTIETIFIGIAAALGVAGLGFLVTWVIGIAVYKFFEWLILGFRDDTLKQVR